jgi:hypothetical protein
MKIDQKYVCETCDYNTSKKSNWNEHILTEKHKRLDLSANKFPTNEIQPFCYDCKICHVKCSHPSILNRHKNTKKHLKSSQVHEKSSRDSATEILLKENQELRTFIIEQSKITTDLVNKALESYRPVNNIINNTNTNNNKFNINLFLNEQCKDAFNFTEFVNNIKISYQDLENNAQLGFVQGISKIFMDNLKQLGINERPIHCTDIKRETMYIKDEDKWTKEVDDSKLQKAIQTVSYKSMGKLMEWKQENPDYQDMDSEFSKRCLDIQRQTLAGSDRDVYYPKVIHVLAKETMVDK